MLQITPQQTIFVAVNPVDFRKGIDGLAALCRSQLNQDPFSGALFVFTNRQRTAVKIIVYDGQGYWLCMKRFSQGKLAWWPKASTKAANAQSKESSQVLLASQLQILLYQGCPQDAKIPEDWRQVKRPETKALEYSQEDEDFDLAFPSFPDNSKEANLGAP
jgi:transposase